MKDKIIVEVSARHIHLTQENIEKLFGAGHQLTPKKELSQPGQFASEERVTVVGSKSELKTTILGPARNYNQVEISLTDARTIGVEAMIRESGHVAKPFMKPAKSASKNQCIEVMKATFDKEVNNI